MTKALHMIVGIAGSTIVGGSIAGCCAHELAGQSITVREHEKKPLKRANIENVVRKAHKDITGHDSASGTTFTADLNTIQSALNVPVDPSKIEERLRQADYAVKLNRELQGNVTFTAVPQAEAIYDNLKSVPGFVTATAVGTELPAHVGYMAKFAGELPHTTSFSVPTPSAQQKLDETRLVFKHGDKRYGQKTAVEAVTGRLTLGKTQVDSTSEPFDTELTDVINGVRYGLSRSSEVPKSATTSAQTSAANALMQRLGIKETLEEGEQFVITSGSKWNERQYSPDNEPVPTATAVIKVHGQRYVTNVSATAVLEMSEKLNSAEVAKEQHDYKTLQTLVAEGYAHPNDFLDAELGDAEARRDFGAQKKALDKSYSTTPNDPKNRKGVLSTEARLKQNLTDYMNSPDANDDVIATVFRYTVTGAKGRRQRNNIGGIEGGAECRWSMTPKAALEKFGPKMMADAYERSRRQIGYSCDSGNLEKVNGFFEARGVEIPYTALFEVVKAGNVVDRVTGLPYDETNLHRGLMRNGEMIVSPATMAEFTNPSINWQIAEKTEKKK